MASDLANGLQAFFHSVYCVIVERELARLGFETQFVRLPINVSDERIWAGVRNRYWRLDAYYLPVCQLPGAAESAAAPALQVAEESSEKAASEAAEAARPSALASEDTEKDGELGPSAEKDKGK